MKIKGFDYAVIAGASVFALIGLAVLVPGIRNLTRSIASARWPKAVATVVTSDTSESVSTDHSTRNRSVMYAANIQLRYAVDGKVYATDTLHFGESLGSGDASEAELRRLRFPVGFETSVVYDPKQPWVAAARPGFHGEALMLPGAALAFIIPAIMFVVLYFGMDRNNSLFGVGLGFFAAIFMAIGAALLIPGLVNLWNARASERWPVVPGRILYHKEDSSTSTSKDDEGETTTSTTYSTRVIYRYQVNGETHFNNVRIFGQLAGSSEEWAAEIASAYPMGKDVEVSFKPDDPDTAALEPGIVSESFWLPGAGAAFLLFGLAVFRWGIPALTGS
ncbi:DUF3592 domain-containing protein [uncultured Paludibaculum sp.]|uniref:DUF3592 domain-containing protein n=1 Tax=uncultured Paludibaculum sp. TaxID=1765020 RepID=UPI002AABECA8|nr:DUF3592 domain-containing protein [uncultured Paludibaculum sp.]